MVRSQSSKYIAFQSESINTKHGYTGHEEDPDTGLVYAEARYYNPSIGRFFSQDPSHIYLGHRSFTSLIGTERNNILSDPQQLNSYSYVRNNPINLTDPSGKLAWVPAAVAAVIAYAPVFTNWATGLVSTPVLTAISLDQAGKDYASGNYGGAILNTVTAGGSGADDAARQVKAVVPSASNYRTIFQRTYGELGPEIQVHHTLPQKYEPIFQNAGINIHDLSNLEAVPIEIHKKISKAWRTFDKAFDGRPGVEQVKKFANKIKKKFGKYYRNKSGNK